MGRAVKLVADWRLTFEVGEHLVKFDCKFGAQLRIGTDKIQSSRKYLGRKTTSWTNIDKQKTKYGRSMAKNDYERRSVSKSDATVLRKKSKCWGQEAAIRASVTENDGL